MSENTASQNSPGTKPDQLLAGNSLVKTILAHKKKLEETRKKLHPEELGKVVKKTVEETFIPDISSIFRYLENVEDKGTLLPYIRDPDLLYKKLNKIILVLQNALRAWNKSEEVEGVTEQLEAEFIYNELLNTCYGLLNEALTEFILVEQAQQVTNTEGDTEPMKKSS